MKAALHTEIGKELTLVNDVELVGPKEGEVLIKTEYCGICHSDVSILDSLDLTPMILGHEAAGVVDVARTIHRNPIALVMAVAECGRTPIRVVPSSRIPRPSRRIPPRNNQRQHT